MTRTLAQQAFALHEQFPAAKARVNATRLGWTGEIQPTPTSRVYEVRVTYAIGRFPRVQVLKPGLETRLGETLPHVFREGFLCLHLEDEWSPDMLIVETTLPWTAEWLINYEIWKGTGQWHGGGQWPPGRQPESTPTNGRAEDGKSLNATIVG